METNKIFLYTLLKLCDTKMVSILTVSVKLGYEEHSDFLEDLSNTSKRKAIAKKYCALNRMSLAEFTDYYIFLRGDLNSIEQKYTSDFDEMIGGSFD